MPKISPPIPSVEIFTGAYCGYCHRAKALLAKHGLPYREMDVSDPKNRQEMSRRLPAARTIPQIFIAGRHVGGCDDLETLAAAGALAELARRKGTHQ